MKKPNKQTNFFDSLRLPLPLVNSHKFLRGTKHNQKGEDKDYFKCLSKYFNSFKLKFHSDFELNHCLSQLRPVLLNLENGQRQNKM